MQFRLAPATGVGNFFSIAGWSSDPNSFHRSARESLDVARDASPFEAVLEEGSPEVGERYRFRDGDRSYLVEIEEIRDEQREGHAVQVVRGSIVGR